MGYIPRDVKHQLAGRIIFPIYDASNNLVSISSRFVDGDPGLLPVYWHESYEKSFYLYGIQNAKEPMRSLGYCIVCEGQFDVMQLHNHGMPNTTGLCGTIMSEVQLSCIHRYCDEVVLLLDKDTNQAGQKGAEKNIAKFGKKRNEKLPIFRDKITSIEFDENLDPDEFVLKFGGLSLRNIIQVKINEMRATRDS